MAWWRRRRVGKGDDGMVAAVACGGGRDGTVVAKARREGQ